MVKFLIALAFGMATLGTAASAEAQELGTQGDMLFGVERIFGIRGEHVDVERPDPLDDDDMSSQTTGASVERSATRT